MQPYVTLQVDLGLPEYLVIQSSSHPVIWPFSDPCLVTWLLELSIGAVYPVLHPEPSVAGVELEVVEVVELGGEGEREVVVHHLQTEDRVECRNILFVKCYLWII